MAVTIQCAACGQSITVRDEQLGRLVACPSCRRQVLASIGASRPRPAASRTPARASGLHVSPMWVALAVAALVIPGLIFGYKWGPGRVQDAWDRLRPLADSQVRDVVERGIRAHLSQAGLYNPLKSHATPHAVDLTFVFGPMYLSMPEKVGFAGTTTEGAMVGVYYPASGEVVADVELGGMSLPGVGALRRGKQKIHVTGRVKNEQISAEVDGQKAEIVTPKWSAD